MSLYPIADVLIIEHRRCSCCGVEYICPSPVISRLLASPAGESRKLVLRPRKEDELPLPISSVHTVHVAMDHCLTCWEPNASWLVASAIVPKRPLIEDVEQIFNQHNLTSEIGNALAKAGFRIKGHKTEYEQALEL